MGLAVRYQIQRNLSLSSAFAALCSVASATIGGNVPLETPSTSGCSQPHPRGIAGVRESVPRTIIVHDVKEPIHVLHHLECRTLSQDFHKGYYFQTPLEESCPPEDEVYEIVLRDALDGFRKNCGEAWIGREGITDKVLVVFENLRDLPSRSTLEHIFPSEKLNAYFELCTLGLIPVVYVAASGDLKIRELGQKELLRTLCDAVVLKVNVFSSLESNDTFGLPEPVLKRMKDLKAAGFTTLESIRAPDNSWTCYLKSRRKILLSKPLYGRYLLEWCCDDFEGRAVVRNSEYASCIDPERKRGLIVHFVPAETNDPLYRPTEQDFMRAISRDVLEMIFEMNRIRQIELQRNGDYDVYSLGPTLYRDRVNFLIRGHYLPAASSSEESQGDSTSYSYTEESIISPHLIRTPNS